MRISQGIAFIWSQAYSEIFNYASGYLKQANVTGCSPNGATVVSPLGLLLVFLC